MIADFIPARLGGPILPATTGTAVCTTTDLDHARLAVYTPPRMVMVLEPWTRLLKHDFFR